MLIDVCLIRYDVRYGLAVYLQPAEQHELALLHRKEVGGGSRRHL